VAVDVSAALVTDRIVGWSPFWLADRSYRDCMASACDVSDTIDVVFLPLMTTFVLTVVDPDVVLRRTFWFVASDRLYTTIRPLREPVGMVIVAGTGSAALLLRLVRTSGVIAAAFRSTLHTSSAPAVS
jgi:hypothetical protein